MEWSGQEVDEKYSPHKPRSFTPPIHYLLKYEPGAGTRQATSVRRVAPARGDGTLGQRWRRSVVRARDPQSPTLERVCRRFTLAIYMKPANPTPGHHEATSYNLL
ncbi:hypothetical protein Pmani_000538 [Petrolisthes manimaculis]|uniref:Uncharacterized protein n=1 Tax=Petrolisthes manimaculis TaxID=1843537 RepID=A0AAE1USL7_9EUCA|nr:hypothetical protein Pmani_000538 [Petrolisthes manimaculis]